MLSIGIYYKYRMHSLVSRNVSSCCQRYSINIDSVFICRFDTKNIDRIANPVSDDVGNCATMLNELIQCRDVYALLV